MTSLEPFPTDFDRVLCIVAHPDDLEYGTAAAVARWTAEGKEVTYLLVTRGEAGIDTMPPEQAAPVREQEERDGAHEVGVHQVDFLDGFADGVIEPTLELRRELARHIRLRRPQLVTTINHDLAFPGGHLNQADHRAVGLAVIDACAAAGNRWIFPELVEDGHEPWGGVRWLAVAAVGDPTHGLDVTATFEQAVASLAAHDQYLSALGPDYPSPRELLSGVLGDPEQPGSYRWAARVHER